jgi:uncharacterized membrane protein HdeD (DUF308 family)
MLLWQDVGKQQRSEAGQRKGGGTMQEIAVDVARQTAPWKPSQSWWLVGIEGIAALIIGIYVVAMPAAASDIIRILIAAALLVLSLGQIVEGFRFRTAPAAPWAILRGGLGASGALLTLLASYWASWQSAIEPAAARQILALGLLAYGVIGIISLLFTFRSREITIAALITDLLAVALGVVLLMAEADDTRGTQLLGVAGIVGGVALLIYAYMLWNRPRRAAAGGTAPATSPPA